MRKRLTEERNPFNGKPSVNRREFMKITAAVAAGISTPIGLGRSYAKGGEMTRIELPQLAWYGRKALTLQLPENWRVERMSMAGENSPALSPQEIGRAVANPIGMAPLREVAKGKKEVAIIFDDMTRGTRTSDILPSVLQELKAAGIADGQIRCICALGCHGAYDREDFAKKLGEDAMARFPVYNHNAFGNCVPVGTTKTFETKVHLNEEAMKCDLKIAIGAVVAHGMSGFGGGGKIILPGIASFETIRDNHRSFAGVAQQPREKPIVGMGIFDDNPLRMDIEEAGELSGLDMLINVLMNARGETTAVFAGSLKPTYAAAVKAAKEHYLTANTSGKDIVIANTYAKANEGFIGKGMGFRSVAPGGDVVVIANAPGGQVTHYLYGPFGNTVYALFGQAGSVPDHVRRLIVYTEYPDLAGQRFFGKSDKMVFVHSWDEVLRLLGDHGAGTKVAVYPSAEIQYCT